MNRVTRLFLGVVAAGVPAAFVWWWLGAPSQWEVTQNGLILTEERAGGQFQVVGVFSAIGLVVGLAAGVVVERLGRPGRWQTVVGLVAASSAAALVCWQLGMWLGPPDPSSVKGLQVGDLVPAQFVVDSIVPFLVWPFAAVLGYTLSLYLGPDGAHEDDFYGDVDDPWADELSERPPR